MVGRQRQHAGGAEIEIDRGSDRAAAAVAQHDSGGKPTKVGCGVAQAAQHLGPQHVAGNAHDEQVVRAFAEQQFQRHARVRATQDRGIGALARLAPPLGKPDITRIDRDLLPRRAILRQRIEQRREREVAGLQPRAGGSGIGGTAAIRIRGASPDKTLVLIDGVPVNDPSDPNGPFGAKEVGQGPLLPMPPCVANAVYDAIGVRVDESPVTPEKIAKALWDKDHGREGRFGPKDFPVIEWPEASKVKTPFEGGDGTASNEKPRKSKLLASGFRLAPDSPGAKVEGVKS